MEEESNDDLVKQLEDSDSNSDSEPAQKRSWPDYDRYEFDMDGLKKIIASYNAMNVHGLVHLTG